jgi:hypothetical protein
MIEQDVTGQTGGAQGDTSLGQPVPTPGQQAQDHQPPHAQSSYEQSEAQQSAGQQPGGQQPGGQSHEQSEGLIPKAAEMAEKAVETGLEKTSGVVGNTIDKVADAAISALGGHPEKRGEPQGQDSGPNGEPSL